MEAMKKVDAVFGPSKMIANFTKKRINRDIKIIETPFMVPKVQSDDSVFVNQLMGKKYILFFGSIGLIKGVGTISRIIYNVLNEHPDLYYVFVGKILENQLDGKSIWDVVKDSAKEHYQRVIHIPSLPQHQLFLVIQESMFVTIPSRTDNFPNTCIEAMACGKIVVGMIVNGFDQLIDDTKSGFVIEVDNHIQLLATINSIINMNSEQKSKIELMAKKKIEQLRPELVLNQLLDLYQETINTKK